MKDNTIQINRKTKTARAGIALAILAAALYALNSPLSKTLLGYLPPTLTAGFLYIGAGVGMAVIYLCRAATGKKVQNPLSKEDTPYVLAMILLDAAAPILLMFGLKVSSAASVSLLNNFEIVATAVIALVFFKEKISARLWLGIIAVTASCVLLSLEDFIGGAKFNYGCVLVLLACVCWGIENNCTRKLSVKDSVQIVTVKGIFSGSVSLITGFCIGERIHYAWAVFAVLAVGFVAYGLSIFFYVKAQRIAGAARTSAYYAVSPFIAAVLSLILFRQLPSYIFAIALAVMLVGAFLCASDKPLFKKRKKTKNCPVSEEAEQNDNEGNKNTDCPENCDSHSDNE